jgi:hypothetical protein
VRLQQQLTINHAAQFHLHKATDAPELHNKALHPEGDEFCQIEGRALPAPVEKAVISNVIQIEVIRERIETSVHVVSALQKDSCGEETRHSSITVAKGVDGDKKKVGEQRVDHWVQTT